MGKNTISNLQNRNKPTDIENKLIVNQRGKGEGRDELGGWD